MKIPNIKPPQISRRHFCKYSAFISLSALILPTLKNVETVKASYFNDYFNHSTVNLGQWMIDNLNETESIALLENNHTFLKLLPSYSKVEVEKMISEDFVSNRVLTIGGILFSVKETILCIIAANYKG